MKPNLCNHVKDYWGQMLLFNFFNETIRPFCLERFRYYENKANN